MREVTFEKAIVRKYANCILIGDGLRRLSDDSVLNENDWKVDSIKNQEPMDFQNINNVIKDSMDCIEYIDFWNEVKICLSDERD